MSDIKGKTIRISVTTLGYIEAQMLPGDSYDNCLRRLFDLNVDETRNLHRMKDMEIGEFKDYKVSWEDRSYWLELLDSLERAARRLYNETGHQVVIKLMEAYTDPVLRVSRIL